MTIGPEIPAERTIGLAIEDPVLARAVATALARRGVYAVNRFEAGALHSGHWPDMRFPAVIATPDALARRARARPRRRGRQPTVILALRRDAMQHHRACLAQADAFVLVDESLSLISSLVPLSRHGLSIMPRAAREMAVEASPRLGQLERLTARELDVLDELSQGRTNQAIADRLGISLGMAKAHIRRIVDRLAFRNRTDAAVFAATLLDPEAVATTLDSAQENRR